MIDRDSQGRLVDGMGVYVFDATGKKGSARLKAIHLPARDNDSAIDALRYIFVKILWWERSFGWFRNKYCGVYLWLIKHGILRKMAEMDAYNSANREKP